MELDNEARFHADLRAVIPTGAELHALFARAARSISGDRETEQLLATSVLSIAQGLDKLGESEPNPTAVREVAYRVATVLAETLPRLDLGEDGQLLKAKLFALQVTLRPFVRRANSLIYDSHATRH